MAGKDIALGVVIGGVVSATFGRALNVVGKSIDDLKQKGDKAETKFNAALSYYKLEVDGQVVYELHPANCIRIINGKD